MAKRVAIAQALIGKPELILLDEPTAGLDPVNVRTVRAIIAEQSSATTFIISSHDLAELDRLCQTNFTAGKRYYAARENWHKRTTGCHPVYYPANGNLPGTGSDC